MKSGDTRATTLHHGKAQNRESWFQLTLYEYFIADTRAKIKKMDKNIDFL